MNETTGIVKQFFGVVTRGKLISTSSICSIIFLDRLMFSPDIRVYRKLTFSFWRGFNFYCWYC